MKTHIYSSLILSFFPVASATAASPPSAIGLQVETTSAVEGDVVPEGLLAGDWANIRAAYEAGRHAFFGTEQGYLARSHGNAWCARFDGQSFTIEPDAGDWSFGLELERYGFESSPAAVDQVSEVRVDGQRLTYDWGAGLSEWWKNETRGLEHGFTVHKRPRLLSSGKGEPLVFDLAVRGGLQPRVMASGRGLRLASTEGTVVLTYDGLVAFDADGTSLEAWLEVTDSGLRIVVLEENARYPLTVDPVMQSAYLKASNPDAGDLFGASVSVSGDTVVVGAWGEDSSAKGVNGNQSDNSLIAAGAAYVFVRTGATWMQQAYLKASNPDSGDSFGRSVAISGDTVVVGADGEDSSATGVNGNQFDNSFTAVGAVYVFSRTGGTWSQQAYLKASNADLADFFGSAVAIDEDTLVVGATDENSSATGVNGDQSNNTLIRAGAAYVFVRTGVTWSQQAYIKASNTGAGDEFGYSVSISGSTVAVGARSERSSATGVNGSQSDNSAPFAGAAYVFVRTGGTWSQQAYIKASNTGAGDEFGESISVSGDTLVVGAPSEDGSATGVNGDQFDNGTLGAGAAFVFVRLGSSWNQHAYLKASNTGPDAFGGSVAVSGDTVVVGARFEDSSATGVGGNQFDDSASGSGAAYVFAPLNGTWIQRAYLKASNTDAGDAFGFAVAVSGAVAVITSVQEESSAAGVNGNESDNSADGAGAVYAYDLSDLGTIGSPLCQPALANSTGVSGSLTALGSDIAADDNLTFLATDLPLMQFGFLINAMNTQMIMISDGLLCIGPDIGRHSTQAGNSGMTGAISTTVDLTDLPRPSGGPVTAMAGQTWYFQLWHRDGPGVSNFTNGIEIMFQ